jgi:hypothetical protein
MKIYAVIMSIKSIGMNWEVIIYFSAEKEKCEKYIGDNKYLEIREYESETRLDNAHMIRW